MIAFAEMEATVIDRPITFDFGISETDSCNAFKHQVALCELSSRNNKNNKKEIRKKENSNTKGATLKNISIFSANPLARFGDTKFTIVL